MTWMSSGAVQGACRRVAEEVLRRAAHETGRSAVDLALRGGAVADRVTGERLVPLARLLRAAPVEREYEYHHRPTEAIDPETGQGRAHIAFAFCVHRRSEEHTSELQSR